MRGRTETRFWLAAALMVQAGLALRLHHIASHFDLDWEPDGYQHVLVAKYAMTHGAQGLWALVDVWAKPIYTAVASLLYAALPARWPLLVAVQLTNTLVWTVAVVLTADIARRELGNPAALLLVALGMFEYVTFRSSVSALTEPLGALAVAAALWCFSRGRILTKPFCIGLAPLARLDAFPLVVVQATFLALVLSRDEPLGRGDAGWRRMLLAVSLSLTPFIVWNALGILHTGHPFFILGGYPFSAAPYGRGRWFAYVADLWRFDPLMLLGAAAALGAGTRWRMPASIRLATIQGGVYFLLISFLWHRGLFGTAGLLRYLVLVSPCFLLGASWLLSVPAWFGRVPGIATRLALGLALTAVLAWKLAPLYRAPEVVHGQLTSLEPSTLGSSPYLELKTLRAEWPEATVHADRPEALYYLGATHGIYDGPSPSSASDPTARGLFVFVPGWSDALFGADPRSWPNLRLLETIPPGILVFVR